MEKWWRRRENYLISSVISLLSFELDKMKNGGGAGKII
jgi:hypothetical protein